MNCRDKTSNFSQDARIPIFVGITGHRDIENEQELINHIYNILLGICEKYQDTPIILLTPLADGADRAAAKAVNELSKANIFKINYMLILPMEEKEYISTFINEDSISEYNTLKRKAIGCYEVPISEELEIKKIQDLEKRHSKLFANLGVYITFNTQILIAVWNGAEEESTNYCKFNNKKSFVNNELKRTCISDGARCANFPIKHGGTYHILRMRFFGIEDEYSGNESYLSNREFGPVYWIRTKRKSSAYIAEGISVVGPSYPNYPIDYSKYDIFNSLSNNNRKRCKKLVSDLFENQGVLNKTNTKNNIYDDILLKINEYNKDISRMNTKMHLKVDKSYKQFTTYYIKSGKDKLIKNLKIHEKVQEVGKRLKLLFYKENEVYNEEIFSFKNGQDKLIKQYAIADVLSQHYQKLRKRYIILLILLAFVGLLSFNLYSGPLGYNWFILAYSTIYFFGTLYYIMKDKDDKFHEKYVEYRGVAEGVRTQFFWHLIGIKTRVTDRYLTKQKSSIDWIRITINNFSLLYLSNMKEDHSYHKYKDNIFIAYKLWLLNQLNYYDKKCPEKDRTVKIQNVIEKAFFVMGLSLALLLAGLDTYEFLTNGTSGIYKMFLPLNSDSDYEWIHKWLIFTVGFLPVIIALFKVFTELLAYSKLSRNYKWMQMVYNISFHEFERINMNYITDPKIFIEKTRKLFYDIGIEALLENGEWIGIFDERVPEMPK